MPNYELLCSKCETVQVEFRNYEERDNPSTCMMCGAPTKRAFITAPGQMNTALPDGTKRKGFADLKEAAKLTELAMDSRPVERKRIESEVQKLTEAKK